MTAAEPPSAAVAACARCETQVIRLNGYSGWTHLDRARATDADHRPAPVRGTEGITR